MNIPEDYPKSFAESEENEQNSNLHIQGMLKKLERPQKFSPVKKLKDKFRRNGLGIADSYFNAYFIYFLRKSEKKSLETDTVNESEGNIHKKNMYDLYIDTFTFIAYLIGIICFISVKVKNTAETLLWVAAAVSVIFTSVFIYHVNSFQAELQIYIGGESIGLVKSVQNLDNSVALLEQNISSVLGMPYKLSADVSYKIVFTKDSVYLSNLDLNNALYNLSQDSIVSAYGLYFDGRLIGAALCEEEIDTILQKVLYERLEVDKLYRVSADNPENFDESSEVRTEVIAAETTGTSTETQEETVIGDVEVNAEHFEFLNEVRVVQAKYPKPVIMSPSELKIAIELASDSKLAISSTIDNALTEAFSTNTVSRDYMKLTPKKSFDYSASNNNLKDSMYYFVDDANFAGAGIAGFEVQFKKIKSETAVVEIPFAIEYRESDKHYQDTKIVEVDGINGKSQVTAQVSYVDDIEIARSVLDVKVLREPVNQVVIIGTKEVPSTEPTGEFICPVSYEYMTDTFNREGHRGTDFAAPFGTSIVAADGGTVVFSGESHSYGLYVVIKHSKGVETLYAHMSERLVETGEKVFKGQPIGKVGSTGNSTGNHLHLEFQIYGKLVNPLDYISK